MRNLEEVSIDDWKPSASKPTFRVPSIWRTEANANAMPSDPDRDELGKIKAYLKAKTPHAQILQIFNISSYCLKKIVKGKYKVNEDVRFHMPSDEEAKEIFFAIKCKIDSEIIQIDYNISEYVFKKIAEGTYKFKKEKKPRKSAVSDEDE